MHRSITPMLLALALLGTASASAAPQDIKLPAETVKLNRSSGWKGTISQSTHMAASIAARNAAAVRARPVTATSAAGSSQLSIASVKACRALSAEGTFASLAGAIVQSPSRTSCAWANLK